MKLNCERCKKVMDVLDALVSSLCPKCRGKGR